MNTENPYASPSDRTAGPSRTDGQAPASFTTVCVLMIVMGALGLDSVLFSVLALAIPAAPGELDTVADRWFLASAAETAIHLLVSLAILAGAILALRRNPSGPGVLMVGSLLAIPYQLVSLVLTSMVAKDSLAAVPQGSGTDARTQEAIVSVTYWLTVTLFGMWSLFVIALLVFAVVYLKRPAVQALFDRPA